MATERDLSNSKIIQVYNQENYDADDSFRELLTLSNIKRRPLLPVFYQIEGKKLIFV